jgi:hypothetical protein
LTFSKGFFSPIAKLTLKDLKTMSSSKSSIPSELIDEQFTTSFSVKKFEFGTSLLGITFSPANK